MSGSALLDAAAPLLASAFVLWGAPVTWLEVTAFVLAVAMVVCNIRVNVLGWPLAIASSLLYFLLFWKSRLYGDASLQIFFALVAGWGWWQWLRGTDASGAALKVRRLGARGRWIALGALAFAWPATGLFLRRYTDTDVPWWDAMPVSQHVTLLIHAVDLVSSTSPGCGSMTCSGVTALSSSVSRSHRHPDRAGPPGAFLAPAEQRS